MRPPPPPHVQGPGSLGGLAPTLHFPSDVHLVAGGRLPLRSPTSTAAQLLRVGGNMGAQRAGCAARAGLSTGSSWPFRSTCPGQLFPDEQRKVGLRLWWAGWYPHPWGPSEAGPQPGHCPHPASGPGTLRDGGGQLSSWGRPRPCPGLFPSTRPLEVRVFPGCPTPS